MLPADRESETDMNAKTNPAPTPDVDAYLASLPPHGWVRIPYPDDVSQWTSTHVALALLALDPRHFDRA